MSSYTRGRNKNPKSQTPRKLLPERLHKAFQIQLIRLNEKNETVDTLFDSAISATSHEYSTSQHPYNINCVYIGEIWRFRLKITNLTNYNISDFGLSMNIEVITKGTSTQIYPRPRELCPKILNRSQSIQIDLEYPVSINTPSTYHLVTNISASNEDDTRLYKEFIQFRALPAIDLSYQKQTLDEMLFVEAFVTNVTCEPQCDIMVNVGFECMGLFKSYNLSFVDESIQNVKMFENEENNNNNSNNNNKNNNNKSKGHKLFLKPNESKTILFQIEMVDPTSLTNLNALSVGQIQVQWKAGARGGVFRSDVIQRQSLFCKKLSQVPYDLEILILKCPSSCVVHRPFEVTFQIFNLDTRYSYKIWLSIDKHTSGYILPINISKKYLGLIESHSNIKTTMSLIALAPGIHLLKGIVIVAKRVDEGHSISGSPRHFGGYHSKHTKPRVKGKGDEPPKTIHYDSLQYIYIDIEDGDDIDNNNNNNISSSPKQLASQPPIQAISSPRVGPSYGDVVVTYLSDLDDNDIDKDQSEDIVNISNIDEEVSVTTGNNDGIIDENKDEHKDTSHHDKQHSKGRKLSMDENDEDEAMLMNEAEHELFALKKMVHEREENDKPLIEPPVMHEDENINENVDDNLGDSMDNNKNNNNNNNKNNNDDGNIDEQNINTMEQDSLVGSTNAAPLEISSAPSAIVGSGNSGSDISILNENENEEKNLNDSNNNIVGDVDDIDDLNEEQSIALNSPPANDAGMMSESNLDIGTNDQDVENA